MKGASKIVTAIGVLSFAGAVVLMTALILPADTGQPEFTTLAIGERGSGLGREGNVERVERTIHNEKEWADFWQEHTSLLLRSPRPVVDFNTEEVLAVAAPYSSYGTQLIIVRVERKESEIEVEVWERNPLDERMLLPAIAVTPFHFVKIRRSTLPVRYSWTLVR